MLPCESIAWIADAFTGSPSHLIVKSALVAVVARPTRLNSPTSPAVVVTHTLPSTANEVMRARRERLREHRIRRQIRAAILFVAPDLPRGRVEDIERAGEAREAVHALPLVRAVRVTSATVLPSAFQILFASSIGEERVRDGRHEQRVADAALPFCSTAPATVVPTGCS